MCWVNSLALKDEYCISKVRRVKKVENMVKVFSVNMYHWEWVTAGYSWIDRVIREELCVSNSGIIMLEGKGTEP